MAAVEAAAGEGVVLVVVVEVLEAVAGLVEVLGEVVTLVAEVREAVGNAVTLIKNADKYYG